MRAHSAHLGNAALRALRQAKENEAASADAPVASKREPAKAAASAASKRAPAKTAAPAARSKPRVSRAR